MIYYQVYNPENQTFIGIPITTHLFSAIVWYYGLSDDIMSCEVHNKSLSCTKYLVYSVGVERRNYCTNCSIYTNSRPQISRLLWIFHRRREIPHGRRKYINCGITKLQHLALPFTYFWFIPIRAIYILLLNNG